MKPGVYKEMSFEDYRKIDAVNFHSLVKIEESPAAAWYARHGESKDSSAFRVGRAVHTVVLERGKVDEEELTKKEVETVLGIAEAASRHTYLQALLSKAVTETTLVWECPDTGLLCKAREDLYVEEIGLQGDLKTVKSANGYDVAKDVVTYWYHAQLAWYERGRKALGGTVKHSSILAVEKERPHTTEIYAIPSALMEQARDAVRGWIMNWSLCEQSGQWFQSRELEVPQWYADKHGIGESNGTRSAVTDGQWEDPEVDFAIW